VDTHSSRAVAVIALLLGLGCVRDVQLDSPSLRSFNPRLDRRIGVYVSPAARSHVATSWGLSKYRVLFGKALGDKAAFAYLHAFTRVELVDDFPPTAPDAPPLVFGIEIVRSFVHPAASTLEPWSADITLQAQLAVNGEIQPEPLVARGNHALRSRTAAVFSSGSQSAYPEVDACTGALADALNVLVDASRLRVEALEPATTP
jgi:hypothetical protein